LVARTRTGRRLDLPKLRPLAELGLAVALDGELVAGAGRMPNFYAVAPSVALRRRTTPMTFVAFDITYLDGDLTGHGYEERRSALEALEFSGPAWATLPRWPGADAGPLMPL
jgi:ATP-dependent DNA ligase